MGDAYFHLYYLHTAIIISLVFTVSLLAWFLTNRWNLHIGAGIAGPVFFYGILAAIAVALPYYIVHFGNRQFGGFDYSIIIDLGWRLVNGQKPYVDFICTMPPAFMLGAKWAILLWGSHWDSQLYLTGLFSFVSFLWIFFLFDRVFSSRFLALFTSLCIQCVTSLALCFWWYNTTASVTGGIFFLSVFLFLYRPRALEYQISYTLSLLCLGAMKPNTAAPLFLGTVVLMLLNRATRLRTIVFSASALLALGAFLVINDVPIDLLFESYNVGSRSRGPKSSLLLQLYLNRKAMLIIGATFTLALLPPFVQCVRALIMSLRRHDYFMSRVFLFLCLGPVVGALAMITNGELKFVDMVLFMIPGAILLFAREEYGLFIFRPSDLLRKYYLSLFVSLALVGLYTGVTRFRVALIGPFFELSDDQRTANPFFPNLHSGQAFAGLLNNVKDLLEAHPQGPVFFGPRLEFAYAAFKLQSPRNQPIWWDPGAAFAKSQESDLMADWVHHRFGLLVFRKNDFIYYGPSFLALFKKMYTRDDSYQYLTVFHLKKT